MQAGILWAHIGLSNDMRVPGLQKILGEQLEKYPKRMESAREFPALIEAGTGFPHAGRDATPSDPASRRRTGRR
jgi:hypothetical protein